MLAIGRQSVDAPGPGVCGEGAGRALWGCRANVPGAPQLPACADWGRGSCSELQRNS